MIVLPVLFFWYWSVEKNIEFSKNTVWCSIKSMQYHGPQTLIVCFFLIAIFLSLYFYYKDKYIPSLVTELIQKHKNVSFFHNKIIFNKCLTRDNRSFTDLGKTTIDCCLYRQLSDDKHQKVWDK